MGAVMMGDVMPGDLANRDRAGVCATSLQTERKAGGTSGRKFERDLFRSIALVVLLVVIGSVSTLALGTAPVQAGDATNSSIEGAQTVSDGEWSTLYASSSSGQSATVVEDVIYVAGGSTSETWVHAYDVQTGAELWSQELDGSQTNGGHAPTVVNGTVYVGGGWHLHAFDAKTGEEKWVEYAGSIRTSPTVYDEYVLIGTSGGSLRSHHAENGTQAWSYSVDTAWASTDSWGQSEHSSVTVVDGTVYATGLTEIHALELEDPGVEPTETDKRWSWETANEGSRDDMIVGALTVLDGTAFVHVNPFEGFTHYDGQTYAQYSSTLVALDDEDGTEQWIYEVDHQTATRGTASPTVVGNQGGDATVYFHANDDVLYAIDAGDGSLQWQTPNLYSSTATSSPTVTDDRVYVGSSTHDDFGNGVFVVDRSTGHQVGFHGTGDYRVTSAPIVVDGFVYGTGNRLVPPSYGDGGKLFAIDVTDDGSSVGSRVLQATLNHHDFWTGADRGDVDVIDATLAQEAILQNDSMAANVTFRNYGSAAVEHNSTLRIGEYRTLHTLYSIDEYDERQETLGSPVTETGTYDVSVDDTDIGTLHVVDPDEPVYLAEGELVDDVVWVERDVEVNATFVNIGSVGGEYEANVTANGAELDTGSFHIDANDSKTTVLAGTVSEPGTYEIAIDGDPIGSVEVLADPTFLVDGAVVNERVLVDETVDARLDLRNLADHPETHEATLAVDDVASTNTSYSLDADEEATENASVTVDETGTYNVSYGNETLGSVEVLSEAIHLLDTDLVDRDLPTAYPDEDVEIALYYENVASTDREHQITVTADDDPAVEKNVTLAAHDREMIFMNVTDLEEGVYDLAVNDEPIETLYVGPYDHFIFENNSIQSVLDNATTNDRLGVASGAYEESLTVEVDGVSISNFAGEEPVLEGGRVSSIGVEVLAEDVEIEGLEIANYTTSGVEAGAIPPPEALSADDFKLRNTTITGTDRGVYLLNTEGAILAHNTIANNSGKGVQSGVNDELELRNNTIVDNGDTAYSVSSGAPSYDHVVRDNTIANNRGGGILMSNSMDGTIVRNHVSDNEGGITVGSRNDVVENVLEGNSQAEILMTGGITASHESTVAENEIVDVAGTGIDSGAQSEVSNNSVVDAGAVGVLVEWDDVAVENNTLNDHEADIQIVGAVNASVVNNSLETGLELQSAPETLDTEPHELENNTVGGDPLFYAANVTDPEIDPEAAQVVLVNVTNAAVTEFGFEDVVAPIQLAHVHGAVVSDNTISTVRTEEEPLVGGAISVMHSSGVEVDGNTLEDLDRAGISGSDVEDLQITNNSITDVADEGFVSAEAIIVINGEGETVVSNNSADGAETGIEVTGAEDVLVADNDVNDVTAGVSVVADEVEVRANTVERSDGDGINVAGRPDGALVANNTVLASGADGLSIAAGEDLEVTGNVVTGSRDRGIFAQVEDEGDGSLVAENEVRANDEGLHLTGHGTTDLENTLVTANVVEDNAEVGLYVEGDQDVLVTENDVTGNTNGLIYAGGLDTLNATNNWWGSADGPSGDVSDPETGAVANATGDSIATEVGGDWILFDPWLDEPSGEPIEEPDFRVSIDDTNEPVDAGETLVVEATIENDGSGAGTQTVRFEDFDGETVDSTEVSLDDGENQSVTFEWVTEEDDDGTDEVTVRSNDDAATTTVTIETVEEPDPAEFLVTIDDATTPVIAGETVLVETTVVNDGEESAQQTIVLIDEDGQPLEEIGLEIDGGEAETVVLEWPTEPGDEGTHTLIASSDDDWDETTVEVLGESDSDIESIAVDGHHEDAGVIFASDDPVVEVTTSGDVEDVIVFVDSVATSFTAAVNATHEGGDDWEAVVPLADIPDDGTYTVTAVAVDVDGATAAAGADEELSIDRAAPSLAATFGALDGVNATVTVSSTDDLLEAPAAAVQYPSGSTAPLDLEADGDAWSEEIVLNESGEYTVTAAGMDLAGNDGTGNASIYAHTDLTIEDGDTITINETGTSIEFETNDTAEDAYAAISEGAVSHQSLADDQLGVSFITADLDESILDEMETATLRVPVDESAMEPVDDPESVSIEWYDDSTGEWDPVDTNVETIDGEQYWVATVDRFSTYGVLLTDETPPEILETFPEDGEELDPETETVTVSVEYDDDFSGVDVGAVSLSVNGETVTDAETTTITSTTAEHILEVDAGESYAISATVDDKAGNERETAFSFDVAESPPTVDDYTDDSDVVQTDGLRRAIDDWRGGVIDTDLLRDVIDDWRTGEPVD